MSLVERETILVAIDRKIASNHVVRILRPLRQLSQQILQFKGIASQMDQTGLSFGNCMRQVMQWFYFIYGLCFALMPWLYFIYGLFCTVLFDLHPCTLCCAFCRSILYLFWRHFCIHLICILSFIIMVSCSNCLFGLADKVQYLQFDNTSEINDCNLMHWFLMAPFALCTLNYFENLIWNCIAFCLLLCVATDVSFRVSFKWTSFSIDHWGIRRLVLWVRMCPSHNICAHTQCL